MTDDDEVCKLIPYSVSQKNTDARGGESADHDEEGDEDDVGARGGQKVQCAQQ